MFNAFLSRLITAVRRRRALCLREKMRNRQREWMAYRIGGGGVVPLGRCTADKAREKVSQFGVVNYIDAETAFIFYADKS